MPTQRIAITRDVSPSIARCELTHLDREPIDLERARAQHGEYEALLQGLGCEIHRLPADPDLPDAVFVEDAALVLEEVAVITRPGAASRRAETVSIAKALEPWRRLLHVEAPASTRRRFWPPARGSKPRGCGCAPSRLRSWPRRRAG